MSAIPAVLDALVSALQQSPALGQVQIVDGPPVKNLQKDLVAVGLSPDDIDVEADTTIAGLGSTLEEFDVYGLARSWSGSGDMKPRRDRAFEILDAVEAVLAADQKLGGVCTRARLTYATYVPARSPDGVLAEIPFRIHVEAFHR